MYKNISRIAKGSFGNFRPTKKWANAYAALYGNGNSKTGVEPQQEELPLVRDEGKGKRKEKKRPKPVLHCLTEQQEQFRAVAWLRKNNILFYHVPNGGYRDYLEAAKFKRLGVSAGVPDICVPVARKGHHGLYIELKRLSGGSLSEHQVWWRDKLLGEGYAWYEAKGANDLILYVKNYLGMV